ncbi:MAG: hypothetical protein HC887_00125 [Desulfobacteraceae bacterium]|nr:hypothetical protein [Desulfobacteraceae bacterium]
MPKYRKRQKNQTESVRRYDCRNYTDCLYDAAKRNAMTIPCADCMKYTQWGETPVSDIAADEEKPMSADECIRGIFQVFQGICKAFLEKTGEDRV